MRAIFIRDVLAGGQAEDDQVEINSLKFHANAFGGGIDQRADIDIGAVGFAAQELQEDLGQRIRRVPQIGMEEASGLDQAAENDPAGG